MRLKGVLTPASDSPLNLSFSPGSHEMAVPHGHPWNEIAAQLKQRYPELPEWWLTLNYQCDDWVRRNISAYFKDIVAKSKEHAEFFLLHRASTYSYWLAFTQTLSDALFWEESECFDFQEYFNGIDPSEYLEMCGLMYCLKTVVTERDSVEACRGMMRVALYCFGDSALPTNFKEWVTLADRRLDQDALAKESMIRINTQLNKFVGFKTLDLSLAANVRNRERIKWEGLASIVSNAHNKMTSRPNLLEWTAEALRAQ
jgi:hypothetical protein